MFHPELILTVGVAQAILKQPECEPSIFWPANHTMLRFALFLLTAIIAKLIIDKLLRRRLPTNRNFANMDSGLVCLDDNDLQFLARYTGVTDLDCLRSHVMAVWQDVKRSQHVYRCIQAMVSFSVVTDGVTLQMSGCHSLGISSAIIKHTEHPPKQES